MGEGARQRPSDRATVHMSLAEFTSSMIPIDVQSRRLSLYSHVAGAPCLAALLAPIADLPDLLIEWMIA